MAATVESMLKRADGEFWDFFYGKAKSRPMRRNESGYVEADSGMWVPDGDFAAFWETQEHPTLAMRAWMVSDNGQLTEEEVCEMTPEEISAFYLSDWFEPEYFYWTSGE